VISARRRRDQTDHISTGPIDEKPQWVPTRTDSLQPNAPFDICPVQDIFALFANQCANRCRRKHQPNQSGDFDFQVRPLFYSLLDRPIQLELLKTLSRTRSQLRNRVKRPLTLNGTLNTFRQRSSTGHVASKYSRTSTAIERFTCLGQECCGRLPDGTKG
jgi:hypothetical protein